MNALKDYCLIQEGTTRTQTEVIHLTISEPGMFGYNGCIASIFIYPIWDEEYADDRDEVACFGYIWKMGKAECHYRRRMKDKHARRWIKRHSKAVRL